MFNHFEKCSIILQCSIYLQMNVQLCIKVFEMKLLSPHPHPDDMCERSSGQRVPLVKVEWKSNEIFRDLFLEFKKFSMNSMYIIMFIRIFIQIVQKTIKYSARHQDFLDQTPFLPPTPLRYVRERESERLNVYKYRASKHD